MCQSSDRDSNLDAIALSTLVIDLERVAADCSRIGCQQEADRLEKAAARLKRLAVSILRPNEIDPFRFEEPR